VLRPDYPLKTERLLLRPFEEGDLMLGFEGLGLRRVKATCDARNESSWRLMERLGLRREAHFRECEIFKGEWRDVFVYAMLAQEYRTLKQG
jgi:RimJ/RimL family protein N-acetyltransferase